MKIRNITNATIVTVAGSVASFFAGGVASMMVLEKTGDETLCGLAFTGTTMVGAYATGIAATKIASMKTEAAEEVEK